MNQTGAKNSRNLENNSLSNQAIKSDEIDIYWFNLIKREGDMIRM